MEMDYLAAEDALEQAERIAWAQKDWDTLARLYMPLQEAHRQKRQRCGEGIVCLDLWAQSPEDELNADRILERYPHGQLLVAGWKSIAPPIAVRQKAKEQGLYVETFLGAVESDSIRIAPTDNSLNENHTLVLDISQIPRGSQRGTAQTFALTMGWWEQLHLPFLAAADAEVAPVRKMQGYRQTIAVDYACELAHQKLSDTARELARQKAGRS